MGYILAIIRFILMFVITTITVLSMLILSGGKVERGVKIRRIWARSVCFALNIKVERRGNLPEGPCLLVGNHRSYLDPVAVLYEVLAYPVAKAEVKKWPIIGYGVKLSGAIYVKRDDKNDRKNALSNLVEAIKKGRQVLIYPEGTTAGEPRTLPFRFGGFAMAVKHNFRVIPIAVDYNNPKIYWVGKDTFVPHFLRTFRKWETKVCVQYGEELVGKTPEDMAQEAMDWINKTIAGFRFEWAENPDKSNL